MARILFLSNLFPPHGYGGYELTCRDVAAAFADAGHEITVLTSDHERPEAATRPLSRSDPQLQAVERSLPLTWAHGTTPPRWKRPIIERRAQAVVERALRSARPAVVSVWNLAGVPTSAWAALARSGVPLAFVLADNWPAQAAASDPWLRATARWPHAATLAARLVGLHGDPRAIGPAGRWIFCSAHLRDTCAATSGLMLHDRHVVHWGVNTGDFPPVYPVPGQWHDRLLFVGRLDAAKGADVLITALAELPCARLELVGPSEPSHLRRLERVAITHGVRERVSFTEVERSGLQQHYREADVCVFPSVWEEPFGIVPLEAMACGTPVIATGTGGSGEYLRHEENCLLVPPGDSASITKSVERLKADSSLRERLALGGLATAAKLTLTRLADTLDRLHIQMVGASVG